MYKHQDMIKLMIATFVSAIGLSALGNYSFIDCLVGMVIANTILQVAYNYTVSSNRPITFTLVFMLYICLAGYSKDYAVKYINGDGIVKLLEDPSTASILCLSAITITFINLNELKQSIKTNTYLWFPSNYIFIFITFALIRINDWVELPIKRISYFIVMIGIIVLCFIRNEIKSMEEIEYDIPIKSYSKYSLTIFTLILIGAVVLPKPEYLPGARWLQIMNWGSTGDVKSSTKLNRNPPTSDEVLFKVYSQEPLYLRSIAYSNYKNGIWSIAKEETDTEPLIDNDFLDEFDILYGTENAKMKDAYIMEVGEYKNYLTVNGIKRISPDNYISIVGDINNICFKEDGYEQSIAYTVEYYDKQDAFNHYEGADTYSMNRLIWLRYLESRNLMDTAYLMSEDEYNDLVDKYTQIPKELNETFRKFALQITTGLAGDINGAKKIEEYLKYTGGYNYVIGAPKQEKLADSVYDFLFNGKKGICQDFASGMTLLCRSIGIPARYVTGYYSDEMNGDGEYIVRSKHAHAFVEVYISGYGWMLFDPTPPGSIGINVGINSGASIGQGSDMTLIDETKKNSLSYGYGGIIVITMVIVVLIWISKVVGIILWKRRLVKGNRQQAIVEIYGSLISIIRSNNIQIEDTKNTTKVTEDMMRLGIDVSDITKIFEQSYYGDKQISKNDIEKALLKYDELKRRKTWKMLDRK